MAIAPAETLADDPYVNPGDHLPGAKAVISLAVRSTRGGETTDQMDWATWRTLAYAMFDLAHYLDMQGYEATLLTTAGLPAGVSRRVRETAGQRVSESGKRHLPRRYLPHPTSLKLRRASPLTLSPGRRGGTGPHPLGPRRSRLRGADRSPSPGVCRQPLGEGEG